MGGSPTANQQYIRPVWNSGLESRIKTRPVHPLPFTHWTRQSTRYVQQKRSYRRNLITIPLINSSPNLSTQSNPLTFLLSNTRSLLPKLDDLKIILDQYGVSMAFITETWLNEKIDDAAVCIDGYSLARRDRIDKLGGGVCAFIKSTIPFKILRDLEDINFETMWIYLRPHKLYRGFSCLIACVVYKPPSSDNNAFIEHLCTTLDLALNKYPNAGIFLLGDFNRCPVSSLLRHFTLRQIVKNPTRKDATLDLILTNMSNICDAPKVIAPIGLSDHNSVSCVLKKCKSMNKCKKIQIRLRNSSAKRAFGRWLTNYNWSNLYHTTSCEQKLELFQDVISTGLDHFLPCKVVKIHDRDKPWITPSYKQLIKSRQKAFFQKDDKLYHQLRNRAFREGNKLKSAFLRNKLEHLKQNPYPKKWWNTVKQIAGFPKKKTFSNLVIEDQVVSGQQLADKINNTFISVTRDLPPLRHIPSSDNKSESTYSNFPIEFVIKEEEVYSRLSAISSSKAVGRDEIPNWVLKSYAHVLALPVTSIFNASLQQASVPDVWKKADVIPVPKNKAPSDINKDLRPISLTATLSKTCERFVADWADAVNWRED